ncbi:LysR family transcriptional regulator [Streptomyces sp. SID3343]|uniref:LysR family transcriptional regulator n=1 Tax=Streptomyces sp. SID3343 TaxID=2690260 RepID=UPI001369F8C4|nr:LysR family transcriptional regulator [Streptomyces sp. SID3343]MYV99294.1 LysR family transcriptional regulator [Streptomyces sp. SID3343]
MELEVRHLRALCAIGDTGSLHAAARLLGMTQPSLTAQLRRIENALGAPLFVRGRTGSRPTPLGLTMLHRARPIMAEMSALVIDTQAEAVRSAGPHLRIGGTANRVIADWVHRLRARLPHTDTYLRVDVSATSLLEMVAAGQLDVAFVHEVEGFPVRVPDGVHKRVLVEREPQFIAMSPNHPAAGEPEVKLADLSDDQWMVDPSVDGEWEGLREVLSAAGINPRILHGDYLTATHMVALAEVVTPCQPTSRPRVEMAIRPLYDDPLAVRLFLAYRPENGPAPALIDAVYHELEAAYREAAWHAVAYRQRLLRADSPLLRADGRGRPRP